MSRKQSTEATTDEKLVLIFFQNAAEKSPAWAKPILSAAGPACATVLNVANKAGPLVTKAYEKYNELYAKVQPYSPDLLLTMAAGFIMMFFGGYFMTLIAVVEAYRICGYQDTVAQLKTLWDTFMLVKKKNDEDNTKDDNNDGIPDTLQIPANQLVTRKLRLFLMNCDPQTVTNALSAIYSGFIAVIAVLRLQFARTVSLGASIGDMLVKPVSTYVRPVIDKYVPEDFKKWNETIVNYTCKAIGVSIAMALSRYLAAFHSAYRGATLFTKAFADWTGKHGYPTLSAGYYDEAFSTVCVVVGLYFQIMTGFSMPWFLAIPLFPLLAVENFLGVIVAYSV